MSESNSTKWGLDPGKPRALRGSVNLWRDGLFLKDPKYRELEASYLEECSKYESLYEVDKFDRYDLHPQAKKLRELASEIDDLMVEIFRENMKSARYFNQPRQYWVSVEKDQSSRRPMPFSNCFVLIQTARVTNQIWSQTKDQVAATLEDPKNKKGQNIPLWMRGHAYAFSYYGLYTSRKVTLRGPTGLNLPDNVVSVILPSGVSKLKTYPKEVTYLKDLLGIRLRDRANPLVASDYAYTTVGEIKREIDRPDRPKPGYILFNVTSQEPDGSPTSTITLSCDLL